MENADKAVLRLGLGMGLSVAIAWGAALEAAFMAPVMTLVLLAKPGPSITAEEFNRIRPFQGCGSQIPLMGARN